MERAIGFAGAAAFFGGLLATTSAFYPELFPWVVGILIAGVVMSATPIPR